MSESAPKRLSFLDLPKELRLDIYELCLSFRATIKLPSEGDMQLVGMKVESVNGVNIPLLQVSKTISAEATAVLYGSNLFVVHLPYTQTPYMEQLKPFPHQIFTDFLKRLSSTNRLLIRRVEIHSKLLFLKSKRRSFSVDVWAYVRIMCLSNGITDLFECIRIQQPKQSATGVQHLRIVLEPHEADDWADSTPKEHTQDLKWPSDRLQELTSLVLGLKQLRSIQIDGEVDDLGVDYVERLKQSIEARNVAHSSSGQQNNRLPIRT